MNLKQERKVKNTLKPITSSHMKEFRQRYGWSQNTFARKLGIDERTYAGAEYGEHLPSLTTLLTYISIMEENERQCFINEICTAIQNIDF